MVDVNGNVWAHLERPGGCAWQCGRLTLTWDTLIEFNGPVVRNATPMDLGMLFDPTTDLEG